MLLHSRVLPQSHPRVPPNGLTQGPIPWSHLRVPLHDPTLGSHFRVPSLVPTPKSRSWVPTQDLGPFFPVCPNRDRSHPIVPPQDPTLWPKSMVPPYKVPPHGPILGSHSMVSPQGPGSSVSPQSLSPTFPVCPNIDQSTEAVIQRCSQKKVLWKYVAQENTHAEVCFNKNALQLY